MRYFVTGATGFLGRELVRQLLSAGHEVKALVRDASRVGELSGVDLFVGDVTDKGSMLAGLQTVDGVFHVAGWYKVGVRDKGQGELVNVQGTRNVLDLIQELGIPKGVYVSTLAVHSNTHGRLVDETYTFKGRHLSEYDRTKAVAHAIALERIARGLPLVITMPGVIYGPGDPSQIGIMLRQYLHHDLPLVPRGAGVCWGYIADTARGLILAMEKGVVGESYHICGEPATYVDALDIAEDLTGIPAPPSVPSWMISLASHIMGLVEKGWAVPDLYSAEALRISAGVTYWGDNSKAREALGFQPRSLRDGLKLTLLGESKPG